MKIRRVKVKIIEWKKIELSFQEQRNDLGIITR